MRDEGWDGGNSASACCAPLRSCAGGEGEPVGGGEPACEAAVPHQPAFVHRPLSLWRQGWSLAGAGGQELSQHPRLGLAGEDGVGAWAATPIAFVLREGAARRI